MAKNRPKRRRSAFPPAAEEKQKKHREREREYQKMPELNERINADESIGGVFGFFRDIGVRETIESVIVAIILALMFRAYEAEAFIIPTGSMAPSLQGQHMDLECEQCQFRYRAGASAEASSATVRDRIDSTYCPICQYRTKMNPRREPDHKSNNGDRILVNKFIYDFKDPERYDVIVFKNPNNGKQNYIKRLIGLPGDKLVVENGDIYLMNPKPDGSYEREITRKPPRKLRHILQVVDDTHFIGPKLKAVKWPSRWQAFKTATEGASGWSIDESGANPVFEIQASAKPNDWLRYRHFQPYKSDWSTIDDRSRLPERFRGESLPVGRLIGDSYGYNDGLWTSATNQLGHVRAASRQNQGLHWVGDIGFEALVETKSDSGTLSLDIVEGGAHFTCSIDVSTGVATLRCDDQAVESKVTFYNQAGESVAAPTAQTNLKGAGSYRIEYVNADDQIHLWVNNKLIEFDAATYSRTGIAIPAYSTQDPGDAEPLGISATNLGLKIDRLKVVRDIYYTSAKGMLAQDLENETGYPVDFILRMQENPDLWNSPEALAFFKTKKGQTEPMFELEKGATSEQDQFLPMGDNSPRSSDGRVWDNQKHYVERDMMIGRAMLVYWPHMKNKPIRYFPNFERMGFIR